MLYFSYFIQHPRSLPDHHWDPHRGGRDWGDWPEDAQILPFWKHSQPHESYRNHGWKGENKCVWVYLPVSTHLLERKKERKKTSPRFRWYVTAPHCVPGVCSPLRMLIRSFIWSIEVPSPWKERRNRWRCGFSPERPQTQSSSARAERRACHPVKAAHTSHIVTQQSAALGHMTVDNWSAVMQIFLLWRSDLPELCQCSLSDGDQSWAHHLFLALALEFHEDDKILLD